jgi:hypothetical protein
MQIDLDKTLDLQAVREAADRVSELLDAMLPVWSKLDGNSRGTVKKESPTFRDHLLPLRDRLREL